MDQKNGLGTWVIFRIFLIAGLTFGGGLAIAGILQEELIKKRRVISKEKFLTYYSLSKLTPTGTQTALAVSLGNYLAGLKGAIVAAAGRLTPVFVSTLVLTIIFLYFQTGPASEILPKAILPAALAVIFTAAISLSDPSFKKIRELTLAAAAFAAAAFLKLPPGAVLIAGGILGIFILKSVKVEEE